MGRGKDEDWSNFRSSDGVIGGLIGGCSRSFTATDPQGNDRSGYHSPSQTQGDAVRLGQIKK
jgi:hypothetical protein